MQTIIEIPLTQPNPRHLVMGADVDIGQKTNSGGSELHLKGTLSGATVRRRQVYYSDEDPYQVTISVRTGDGDVEMEFDLDDVVITYQPKMGGVSSERPRPDSCVYLG